MRRRADENAVDRRGRLQARRGVDDVARDERLALGRVRVERDQRLTGVDGDADLEAVLDQRVAHRERRTHGALGVVLVRVGAPKTAITASPMNFSTVPP